MDKIELKAYAKINLGLDVVRRLDNGYHEVKMIMQQVSLWDMISIERNEKSEIKVITDTSELPGDKNNLAYRAAKLLTEEFNIEDGVVINLQKNIPIAAGLAGGSSDAAAVLLGMNKMFFLNLTVGQLQERGVKLGADIPYCIAGGTYLSEGIGEKLTELPPVPDCFVLLAKPDIPVSTKWVYENLNVDSLIQHPDIDGVRTAIEEGDLSRLCSKLENVLESVTVRKFPIITDIKNIMEDNGALKALMSGSGPTVFGIFDSKQSMEEAALALSQIDGIEGIYKTAPVNR